MAEEQSLVLVGSLSIPEALEPHITTTTPGESSSVVPGRFQSSSTVPVHQQPPQMLLSLPIMNSLQVTPRTQSSHCLVSARAQPLCLKGSALQPTSIKRPQLGNTIKQANAASAQLLQAHKNHRAPGKFKLQLISYAANCQEVL